MSLGKQFWLQLSLIILIILAAGSLQILKKKSVLNQFFSKYLQNKSVPAITSDAKIRLQSYQPHLSDLGTPPDWKVLSHYQETISKENFLQLLNNCYTLSDYWKKWIRIEGNSAIIYNNQQKQVFSLLFATNNARKPTRYWRTKEEISKLPERTLQNSDPSSKPLPLIGIRIAIDPGHIGGKFAIVEERNMLTHPSAVAVREGTLTLQVAKALEQQLTALGASVTLTRESLNPVNPLKADSYIQYSKQKSLLTKAILTQFQLQKMCEKMFYRTGEIRARAFKINQKIKPDIVLCLHFNAEITAESLYKKEHFHMILHGAVTENEMHKEDQRLEMLHKIFQGSFAEEKALSSVLAKHLAKSSGLPAYQYKKDSSRAINIGNNPYLWARNLLANRLYQCPVLYFEPYLMNGKTTYEHIQLGDYDGFRFIDGNLRRSIYKEYAEAVTLGLVEYYTQK